MKPKRIAVVTSSRADYGHLYWPLVEMKHSPRIDLRLLVTGAHLEAEYGHTVDVIRADGFDVEAEIPCFVGSKRDADMGLGIARATEGFTRVLDTLRPDALVVIADRYEMMGPALAAMACRIPIVHIEGASGARGSSIRSCGTRSR